MLAADTKATVLKGWHALLQLLSAAGLNALRNIAEELKKLWRRGKNKKIMQENWSGLEILESRALVQFFAAGPQEIHSGPIQLVQDAAREGATAENLESEDLLNYLVRGGKERYTAAANNTQTCFSVCPFVPTAWCTSATHHRTCNAEGGPRACFVPRESLSSNTLEDALEHNVLNFCKHIPSGICTVQLYWYIQEA